MSDKTVKYRQTGNGDDTLTITQLKSQLASQQKRFADLNEANFKLQEVISKLKEVKSKQKKRLVILQEVISKLKEVKSKQKKRLVILQEVISKLKEVKSKQQKRFVILQEVNSKRSEAITKLRAQLETANRENHNYKQQLDRQQTLIQRWERDLEKEACALRGHVPGAARVLTAPTSSSSEAPPIVLIASGGSSGSHLLAQLLAHYVPFFAGQEPNLASRPDLFDPITFRTALLKGLQRSDPAMEPLSLSNGKNFFIAPPMVLTNPAEYCCDSAEGQVHLLESRDWGEMISRLVSRLGGFQSAPEQSVLIEHSPSCAISLPTALQAYPNLKAIHLLRDPRDAILSMMERRAKLPTYATLPNLENLSITATQWCALNAVAMRAEGCSGYMQVTYEELVRRPVEVVDRVLAHLGYPNAEQWQEGAHTLSPLAKQIGWRFSPMGAVSTGSIGRYHDQLTEEQACFLDGMVVRVPEIGVDVRVSDYIESFGSADPVSRA